MIRQFCVFMMLILLSTKAAFADMQLDHMVETLRSLDIEVNDEMIVRFEEKVSEIYASLPAEFDIDLNLYSYENLLRHLGMGEFDPEAGRFISEMDDVYAFDMEAYDIVYAYEDLLMAIDRMGSNEIQVNDIVVEYDFELFMKGYGKMTIRYNLNGNEYAYSADFQMDWMDCRILDDVNKNLKMLDIEKCVWNMFDDGQGLILFCDTEQWAQSFEAATG